MNTWAIQMTNDPLITTYRSVGWAATWDVLATIALARYVEERVARIPYGRWPEIIDVREDGSVFLIYSEEKPGVTAKK